jgi:hypothetical protein
VVWTGQNLAVAKVFYAEVFYERHTKGWFKIQEAMLPAVLNLDPERMTVLLEYKEGIPVDEIKNRGVEIGFTTFEVSSIVSEWEKWRAKNLTDQERQIARPWIRFLARIYGEGRVP